MQADVQAMAENGAEADASVVRCKKYASQDSSGSSCVLLASVEHACVQLSFICAQVLVADGRILYADAEPSAEVMAQFKRRRDLSFCSV